MSAWHFDFFREMFCETLEFILDSNNKIQWFILKNKQEWRLYYLNKVTYHREYHSQLSTKRISVSKRNTVWLGWRKDTSFSYIYLCYFYSLQFVFVWRSKSPLYRVFKLMRPLWLNKDYKNNLAHLHVQDICLYSSAVPLLWLSDKLDQNQSQMWPATISHYWGVT